MAPSATSPRRTPTRTTRTTPASWRGSRRATSRPSRAESRPQLSEPDGCRRRRQAMTAREKRPGSLVRVGILILMVAGCARPAVGVSPTPSGGIGGSATAGPTCPVEKVPADPACAPRPVCGAVVVVRDGSGVEVARAMTGADGTFFVALGPGSYVVAPQPVEGLMGVAPEQSIDVAAGARSTIVLAYDTGIRGPVSAP